MEQAPAEGHPAVRRILDAAIFVSFFDTFALLPVLPVYVRSLGAAEWEIGVAVSVYSLVGLLLQGVGGYSVDRVGRKPVMVWSLVGAAVALGLYGLVPAVGWLLFWRAFHGATGAFFVPALFAAVGEQAGERRRAALGRAGALIGLAAIVAPPIGGAVARQFGAPVLFGGIAAVMAVMALLVWRFVPETLRVRRREEVQPLLVLRVPVLVAVYAMTAAFTFCMGTLAYGFPLRVVELGYSTSTAGQLLGLMALVAVPVMAGVRQWQSLGRIGMGLGIVAVCLAVLWWVPELWVLALLMVFYGIGFGLVFPALHVLVFEQAPAHLRGSAFAVLYIAYSGGIIVGPIVSGAIAQVLPPGVVAAGVACGTLGAVVAWLSWVRRTQWAQS